MVVIQGSTHHMQYAQAVLVDFRQLENPSAFRRCWLQNTRSLKSVLERKPSSRNQTITLAVLRDNFTCADNLENGVLADEGDKN